MVPVDDAGIGRHQHDDAENDAVPGKHHEAVAGNEAQQPAHAEEGRDKGKQQAHRPDAQIVRRQQRAVLIQRVQPWCNRSATNRIRQYYLFFLNRFY